MGVTQSPIRKATGTTKGDMVVYQGNVDPKRLGVGADDQVLTADSAEALGVKWAAAAGGGQTLYDAIIAPSGGDYTDIQSAIDAGKHKLFIRAGTYTLSADIVFAAAETVLIGESWDSIIACGTSYKINVGAYANCRIEGLKITGTQTTNGVITATTTCNKLIIRNCYFDATYAIGVASYDARDIWIDSNFFTGTAGKNGILSYAERAIATNNIFYQFARTSSETTVYLIGLANAYSTARGNIIYDCGSTSLGTIRAIYLTNHGTAADNVIYELRSKRISGGNIYGIQVSNYSTVTGNAMYRLGFATGYGYIIYGIHTSGYCTITNNTMRLLGNNDYAIQTYGIYALDYNTIVGNFFQDLYCRTADGVGYGIFVRSDTCVMGNSLRNVLGKTWHGIRVITGQGSVVTGNAMRDASWTTAISQESDSSANVLLNNSGADGPVQEKNVIRMKNTSGGSLALGDVVILKAVAAGNEVTTTTTGGDKKVFGMAMATIADAAFGYIQTLGKTVSLKADGTDDIAIGDFLSTFTTAKIAKKAAAGDMAFAIALEAYTADDSNGVIDALLVSPRMI